MLYFTNTKEYQNSFILCNKFVDTTISSDFVDIQERWFCFQLDGEIFEVLNYCLFFVKYIIYVLK